MKHLSIMVAAFLLGIAFFGFIAWVTA